MFMSITRRMSGTYQAAQCSSQKPIDRYNRMGTMNDEVKIYWSRKIQTDKPLPNNTKDMLENNEYH